MMTALLLGLVILAAFVNTDLLVGLGVVFAALAYIIVTAFDTLGWSRSSKTLRTENEDLIRRNKELDQTIIELRGKQGSLEAEVTALRSQVAELSKRDQGAVLVAISHHEESANRRWSEVITVLTDIRDAVQSAPGGSS